jgi:hypothetical protein
LSQRSDLRSTLFTLVIAVVALDVAAIAIHELADMESRGSTTRYMFGAAWLALTLLIVLRALARIRVARLRARARR